MSRTTGDRVDDVVTDHMVAVRWWGPRELTVDRVPVPLAAPDEALVRVHWTGLCGSDLEEYLDGPVVARAPRVLGHEVVGEVAVPAADGSGPPVGTPVVVDVVTGCGHCHWCVRHEEGRCPDLVVTGQHRDGGLAEYVVARASRLVVVPEGLDLRAAVLAEPLAVAVRALRKAGSLVGRGVLVVGGGTVGMLVAQAARSAGASRVLVLEPEPSRRLLVRGWGIEALWAGSPAEREELVDRALPAGADVVLECAGAPGVAAEAISLSRTGGTTILLGVRDEPAAVDLLDVVLREKVICGTAAHMWDDDVSTAVDWLAEGRVDTAGIVTHAFPLVEGERAFAALADPEQKVVKVVVDCRGGEPGRG